MRLHAHVFTITRLSNRGVPFRPNLSLRVRAFNNAAPSSSVQPIVPLATSLNAPSASSVPHTIHPIVVNSPADIPASALPADMLLEFPAGSPEQKIYSILPDAFIDHLPVDKIAELMQVIHVQGHVPWWLTLMATTVALRVCLAPFIVYHVKTMAHLSSYRLWLFELWRKGKEDALNKKVKGMGFVAFFKSVRRHLKDDGFSFSRFLILPAVTFPVFISYAVALRKSFALDPSFCTGGILWFKDLTIPDNTCMLALACTATSLLAIHFSSKPINTKPGELTKGASTNPFAQFFQVVTICFFPVLTYVNSGLLLYWFTSSLFGIGMSKFLRIPAVRDWFGLQFEAKAITPAMQEYGRYLAHKNPVIVDYNTLKSRKRTRR